MADNREINSPVSLVQSHFTCTIESTRKGEKNIPLLEKFYTCFAYLPLYLRDLPLLNLFAIGLLAFSLQACTHGIVYLTFHQPT